MDGLGFGSRIDENHVDALISKGNLQLGGQSTCSGCPIGQELVCFHAEIDISPAAVIIDPRTEQSRDRG